MKVTVDASVAVKWFVMEDHRKEARQVLGPRIERYAARSAAIGVRERDLQEGPRGRKSAGPHPS